MTSNYQQAINFIKNNNRIGIKAGKERPGFLEIWMVIVDGRIFARSWGLAERSWYNAFLNNPNGEIECGEKVIAIKASIPKDLADLTEHINKAYKDKYPSERNKKYVDGIIQYKHVERTMEFEVID